jgi:hypothetical protein
VLHLRRLRQSQRRQAQAHQKVHLNHQAQVLVNLPHQVKAQAKVQAKAHRHRLVKVHHLLKVRVRLLLSRLRFLRAQALQKVRVLQLVLRRLLRQKWFVRIIVFHHQMLRFPEMVLGQTRQMLIPKMAILHTKIILRLEKLIGILGIHGT